MDKYLSPLVSCLECREVKSAKGLFTHIQRKHGTEEEKSKYSSGYNGKYEQISKKSKNKTTIKELEYLQNPKRCQQCNSVLNFNIRFNKFCNVSCSATYTNSRKDYTKFKPGPKPGQKNKIENICEFCSNSFVRISKRRFCSTSCSQKYRYIENRKNKSDLEKYRTECVFKFSLYEFPDEFDFNLIETYGWYKAKNRGDNQNGISRDHKVSVKYGFEHSIDSNIISHPANCQLLPHKTNVSKGKKNSITLEALLDLIEKWEEKYSGGG